MKKGIVKKGIASCIRGALVVFLFASSSFATAGITRSRPSEGGGVAPGFSLETVEGRRVALEDFKGRKIILVFFTTWCPYCAAKLSALEKEKAQFEKEGIVLLPIDVGESSAKVASFRAKRKIGLDILLDQSMSVARKYRVIGVPTFFLIGTNGVPLYEDNDLPRNYREIFGRE